MTDGVSALVIITLYLAAGRFLYKQKWPEGFMPTDSDDEEIERIRRVGRRRVQPVPHRNERPQP